MKLQSSLFCIQKSKHVKCFHRRHILLRELHCHQTNENDKYRVQTNSRQNNGKLNVIVRNKQFSVRRWRPKERRQDGAIKSTVERRIVA